MPANIFFLTIDFGGINDSPLFSKLGNWLLTFSKDGFFFGAIT